MIIIPKLSIECQSTLVSLPGFFTSSTSVFTFMRFFKEATSFHHLNCNPSVIALFNKISNWFNGEILFLENYFRGALRSGLNYFSNLVEVKLSSKIQSVVIIISWMKYTENKHIYYLLTLKERDLFLSTPTCVIKGYEIMLERYGSRGQIHVISKFLKISATETSFFHPSPIKIRALWFLLFHVIILTHRVTQCF